MDLSLKYQAVNKNLLFLLLIMAAFFFIVVTEQFFITDNLYYDFYGDSLPIDQVNELFE